MYENQTFEVILQRMLNQVTDQLDKREGSPVYSALAPAAAEFAQLYIQLDVNKRLAYVQSSSGDVLTALTAQQGVNRKEATPSVRIANFTNFSGDPFDVSIGDRFSDGNVNYIVTRKVSLGEFELTCETDGIIGNQYFGPLTNITFVVGLGSANLSQVVIPGSDEETDDALKLRFEQEVNEPAFGGNVADYKAKTNAINGVGGTKVYPTWNGGGTVRLVFVDSEFKTPNSSLVNIVQTTIDPIGNQGNGIGLAPIGHTVTVSGAASEEIEVYIQVVLQAGYTVDSVKQQISDNVHDYINSLIRQWQTLEPTVVRISQIEARALDVPGVVDIVETLINYNNSNVVIATDKVVSLIGVDVGE